MGAIVRDLVPHMAAMLVGGITSSFGLAWIARTPRGQTLLSRIKVWGMVVFAVLAVGALVGGFYWLFSRIGRGFEVEETLGSPFRFLLLGLAAGLPLSLPGVITAWNDARPEKAAARAKKAQAASRSDRLDFAQNLVRQIKEYAETGREISASLTGDKGEVLLFEGDLERHEGDKLVAALKRASGARIRAGRGRGPQGQVVVPGVTACLGLSV